MLIFKLLAVLLGLDGKKPAKIGKAFRLCKTKTVYL